MNRSIDGLTTRSSQPELAGGSLSHSGARTSRGLVSFPLEDNQEREVIRRDHGLGGRLAARERPPASSGREDLAAEKPKKPWRERLQLPVIIIGGMLAGFAIQNALLGQILIIGYGLAALMYRIPSRTTFIVALAAMSVTIGFLVLKGDLVTSQTFALYSFLLLVVGVITLNREVKQEGGRIYSRRYK